MKRIGILGGISYTSTARYYTLLHERAVELGEHDAPEVVVYSLRFGHFTFLEDSGDRGGYRSYILGGIHALERCGCDVIAMAANSPHAEYDAIAAACDATMVSITEATARAAVERGLSNVLLLGISFTMLGSFYHDACSRYGIHVETPTLAQQSMVSRIIFEELARGIHSDVSRRSIVRTIADSDAEGVILGCTELPLLLSQQHVARPVLDTLDIHVSAILDAARGLAPLPTTLHGECA